VEDGSERGGRGAEWAFSFQSTAGRWTEANAEAAELSGHFLFRWFFFFELVLEDILDGM
jgi:hypothetical protein